MAKCKYKYKNYPNKKCPHDAEPGSDFCKWHEQKDGKDFSGQKIKDIDLIEAYLRYANLQETNCNNVSLQGANLMYADFQKTRLNFADLSNATLQYARMQETDLSDAYLQGTKLFGTNLEKADLSFANLQGANLYDSDLTDTLFNNGTDLRGAILYAAEIKNAKKLQYAKISGKNPGEMCIEELLADNIHNLFNNKETDFGKALNEVIRLHIKKLGFNENEKAGEQFEMCKNIYIPNEKSLEKIFEKKPISRYEENRIRLNLYKMAKDVYINLKNYFKNAGLYDESGNFFIGEFRVRGKIHEITAKQSFYELLERTKNFFRKFILRKHQEKMTYMSETKSLKLIGSMISNCFSFLINKILCFTSLYGESVWRIILTAPSVIGFYAAIYWLSKGITYGTHSTTVHSFLTDLYFSIVTFTTLGYGDLHPVARTWVRIFAGSEAFLGAFILAYFVVIVSRKIMR